MEERFEMAVDCKPLSVATLVEEDGLVVQDYGWDEVTGVTPTPRRTIRRFIDAFSATWRQIPERDRLEMTEFWKQQKGGRSSPQIILGGPQLIALYRNRAACVNGRELYFSVLWLDDWKRAEMSGIIAHELGHVICYPHGWYKQHVCTAYHGNECVACECRAYSYMASWGFDPFHAVLPKPNKMLAERFRSLHKL